MTSTIAATGWEHGRFDSRDGPRQLLFGRMYEDAAIESGAFRPGGRICCIASAGCTAIQLASSHDVVAVDLNPVQLAYVQRRLADGSSRRGSVEHILGCARALGPLAGWSRSRLRAFLALEHPMEQMAYWRRYLDTARFRAALDCLLSVRLLRWIYSAPLLDVLPSNFGAVLRRRMERGFALHSNRANPYARALLLGEMTLERKGPESREIQLVHADAAAFLERQPAGSFDGFALSNILDGANAAYQKRLLSAVKHAAAPGAVVVRRSFREPSFTEPTNHAAEDRAMLWGIVDVRSATCSEPHPGS